MFSSSSDPVQQYRITKYFCAKTQQCLPTVTSKDNTCRVLFTYFGLKPVANRHLKYDKHK